MKTHRSLLPLLTLTFALPASLHGEVKLPRIFSPHMVLQRGMAVPVWGTATAGEKVTVAFAGQTKTAVAEANGAWRVTLDALAASAEPRTLTASNIQVTDVLVGEVWIGSGQSNMDMPVSYYTANDPVLAEAAKAAYPKLRLMRKDANAAWQEATPETIGGFSALLFSFGFPLQKELNVPVGLVVGAAGGTPSGFWLSEEMYRTDAACAEAVKIFAPTYNYEALLAQYAAAKAKYNEELAAWKPLAEAAEKEGKPAPAAPRAPQPVGKAGEMNSGKIGALFETYIRPYAGYAIKGVLWDQGESGTNIAGVDQVTLMGALINGWRKAWGQGDFPFLYVQKPSGGGPAWNYAKPMTSRANKFSPLPKAIPPAPDASYSHSVFLQIMRYPNTFMVSSLDLGGGIHPANKSGYGERAAQVALGAAYGHKLEILGPIYASHLIDGGKVRVTFTHTGQGLAFKNGDSLQGFMIAGSDKKFVWADATIDEATVVVSSKDVPQPAAVRYAWSQQFPWANLFNKDGFPAQPFRTDAW